MQRCVASLYVLASLVVLSWTAPSTVAQKPSDPPAVSVDLSDFRTIDKAITTPINKTVNGSRPLPGYLGIHVKGDGRSPVAVVMVQGSSPAAKAGLQPGDVLHTVDRRTVSSPEALRELLQGKSPGETLPLVVLRGEQRLELSVPLGATSRPLTAPAGGPKTKGGTVLPDVLPLWNKNAYRLAVVLIEFSDIKRNEKITANEWEEALFSRSTYVSKMNATGQPVHGSLNDYYQEQSQGKFRLEGKVVEAVQAAKKRGDYYQGAGAGNKTALLSEVLDKLTARDGKDALKDFDGLCFIFAGGRAPTTNRGSLYYPHRGSVQFQGKRWPYIICPEGGSRMENISVFAPEFGKLLGLPELFARPENAGSEGLGVWCLMSNGAGDKGKPGHLSAWCKEQLGWLEPAVIDPTTRQKLILAPVQSSRRECVKVLVRLDGSEYLLLENRTAEGFDAELPGQGVLVWRVVAGRPSLEEAHGITGPSGPRVSLDAVPFPSKANNAFTPFTTPSSRSITGGGLPVYLTNIRRLPDGRVTFFVGYEYY